MKRLVSAVLLTTVIVGCASLGQTLRVSGTTLKAIGDQFVSVAEVYKQGCDVDHVIPADQCQQFRVFGLRFKQTYPLTVAAWEVARRANDVAGEKAARRVIEQLAEDLSQLAVVGINTFHGGK